MWWWLPNSKNPGKHWTVYFKWMHYVVCELYILINLLQFPTLKVSDSVVWHLDLKKKKKKSLVILMSSLSTSPFNFPDPSTLEKCIQSVPGAPFFTSAIFSLFSSCSISSVYLIPKSELVNACLTFVGSDSSVISRRL